ncbi:MAG: hypothetical protein LBO00_06575, partial [Zoogloeaceae bacterium]|nr:hypothetical protein [Zoogloeaceae bacterium]
MTDNDELFFAEEEDAPAAESAQAPRRPWVVMIVDDEPGIHSITRLALAGFVFEGRALEFISA